MERNLPFTLEHEIFRKAFRDFVENEIVAHYKEWEMNHIVDGKHIKRWAIMAYPSAERSARWEYGPPIPQKWYLKK